MKTTLISSAFILCTSLLAAQTKNKPVTVHIKKIENINGVETIKDSTYTSDETSIIKADGDDIRIIHAGENIKGGKVIILNENSSSGKDVDVSIMEGNGTLSPEIEKALKEAGVDVNLSNEQAGKRANCVRKTVVVHSDDSKSDEGEKKCTKIVIIKKVSVTDASESDLKMLGKQTGVTDNKLELSSLNFYPNPSNGKFNLSFNLKEKGNTDITVLNMEGKKVYSEKLNDFTGAYDKEIDISKNPKGVYFVRVEQGQHSQLKKIVLE